ncbi:MAG TPA: tyrosine-protein phosphatase [Gemmataceae bacterium]|nr:tyrosine-protein phosphatase [Gemmataceae bacterium]
MPTAVRWILGLVVAALVVAVPIVHFRWIYTHGKRLREVTPGKFYRSGEMTLAGFREAHARYHFRTIVNLQDEYPDPDLSVCYLGGGTVKESELCRQLGIRYVYLPPDLIPRRQVPAHRPEAIDRFLALLDDPASYPVLIHCRAGLHRTGVMTAVYRMEYGGWTPGQAIVELKANGFGEWPCTAANDYITQYILTYQRGLRHSHSVVRAP